MIREIGTLVAANVAGLTLGDNLFIGHWLQDAPDSAVLLSEYGGGSTDYYVIDKEVRMLQVRTRAITYLTARDRAYAVYHYLHGGAGYELPVIGTGGEGYRMEVCEAAAIPQSIGQDEKRRWEFSTNYRCVVININGDWR